MEQPQRRSNHGDPGRALATGAQRASGLKQKSRQNSVEQVDQYVGLLERSGGRRPVVCVQQETRESYGPTGWSREFGEQVGYNPVEVDGPAAPERSEIGLIIKQESTGDSRSVHGPCHHDDCKQHRGRTQGLALKKIRFHQHKPAGCSGIHMCDVGIVPSTASSAWLSTWRLQGETQGLWLPPNGLHATRQCAVSWSLVSCMAGLGGYKMHSAQAIGLLVSVLCCQQPLLQPLQPL